MLLLEFISHKIWHHIKIRSTPSAIHQRTTPDISGPESLTDVLTAQLQSCLAAMDGKMGGETVIGETSLALPTRSCT
jgi:hypothetical protein